MPHQAKAALQSFLLNNPDRPGSWRCRPPPAAWRGSAVAVAGRRQDHPAAAGQAMVCIGDEHGAALVRYGHRFAQRRQLPWLVVHIDSRGKRSPSWSRRWPSPPSWGPGC